MKIGETLQVSLAIPENYNLEIAPKDGLLMLMHPESYDVVRTLANINVANMVNSEAREVILEVPADTEPGPYWLLVFDTVGNTIIGSCCGDAGQWKRTMTSVP